MEYYSAIKNNKILPLAAMFMDLENIMLSEISQREKDKYCMISLICKIFKNTNKCICKTNRLTDIENKLVVTSGEREGGGGI